MTYPLLLAAVLGLALSPARAADADEAAKPAKKTPARNCVVGDFRTLAMTTHDPAQRHTRALAWLRDTGRHCSVEKLKAIRNNRSTWLGTSDTPEIATLVDRLIEAHESGDKNLIADLYGSKPAPKPSSETVSAEGGTNRVVTPPGPAIVNTFPPAAGSGYPPPPPAFPGAGTR